MFTKNWSIGRLREYTSGKAAEPPYAALKPLFRQVAGHLIDDAERLPEKYNRTAYSLAANYLNGTGDYTQAIDAIRKAVRAAVQDGTTRLRRSTVISGTTRRVARGLLSRFGSIRARAAPDAHVHSRSPKVGLYTRQDRRDP